MANWAWWIRNENLDVSIVFGPVLFPVPERARFFPLLRLMVWCFPLQSATCLVLYFLLRGLHLTVILYLLLISIHVKNYSFLPFVILLKTDIVG
jgi:hypothetical protein